MPPATNQVSSPRRSREPLWSFIAAHAILCINPARAFLTPTSAIGSLPCSTSSPSPFVSQARPFPAGKLWSQCPPTPRTSPTNNAIEIRQPLLLPAAAHSRDNFLRFLPRPPPSLSPPPSPASHHIRRMSLSDLSAVVLLAAREFTPLNELAEYGGTPSGGLVEEFEAWGLRQKVRWGMLARYLYPDDHEVLLLVEGEEGVHRGKRGKEAREGGGEGGAAGLLGMVELSLQPTTGLPPPLFPLSPAVKGLFALLGWPLQPYISNLLVDVTVRRQGHAARLVAVAEAEARARGHSWVYLHADSDYLPAVRLYERLGYRDVGRGRAWVDRWTGLRLRYMRKEL